MSRAPEGLKRLGTTDVASHLIQDDRVGDLAVEPLSHRDVRFWRVESCRRGRANNFCSEGPQNVNLLGAHFLRQDDDAAVALDGGGQGQADAFEK